MIRVAWLIFELHLLWCCNLNLSISFVHPKFKRSVCAMHMTIAIKPDKKYILQSFYIDSREASYIPRLLIKLSYKSLKSFNILFNWLMIFVFSLYSYHVLNYRFLKINLYFEIRWASQKLLFDFVLFLHNLTNNHAKLEE